MSEIPTDLALLAQIWECPHTDEFADHPGEAIANLIEREFQAGTLAVYGRESPHSLKPVQVPPTYCEINWIGPLGTTGYQPCAEPITDPMRPWLLNRVRERYYDLTIT